MKLDHLPPSVCLSDEVRATLVAGGPVVALETAVLTHGLPAPRNLEAMEAMAAAIRSEGAVPAVCLIGEGRLWIGADDEPIRAAAADPAREKASVRELGAAVARGVTAGLTVSATLFAAQLAGIRVFATGGIGGVHLGATETGDVSADLLQLSRNPVIVVCAGAKSVLDIPRTLEFLEMAGVPVFSYRSERFPAFYLTASGVSTAALSSPDEIARAARAQWAVGYESGVVIGNPIPAEDAIPLEEWQTWLDRARQDAVRENVTGKDVTPYLLERVAAYSGGRTVEANISLLRNNALLAARIARALVS